MTFQQLLAAASSAHDDPTVDALAQRLRGELHDTFRSASPASWWAQGWETLLPAAVSLLYKLCCLAHRDGADLPDCLAAGDPDRGFGTLTSPLAIPADELDALAQLAPGTPRPETAGEALAQLAALGLLTDDGGRLAPVLPVPDPTVILDLDEHQRAALADWTLQRAVLDTLDICTSDSDTVTREFTLAQLAEATCRPVDAVRDALAHVADAVDGDLSPPLEGLAAHEPLTLRVELT